MYEEKKYKYKMPHSKDEDFSLGNALPQDIPENLKDIRWWQSTSEKGEQNKAYMQTNEVMKKNPEISKILPGGGDELADIPDKMGYFETETVGTVLVGYDRYKSKSDLAFTVVANQDKVRSEVPKRDADHPNTYFGGEATGSRERFKAGAISFRYDRKSQEIDKVSKNKYESPLNDEESLLYQDEKEKERLERLRQQKAEYPNGVARFDKEEKRLRKIRDKKREENSSFLEEIRNFVRDLDAGKIKRVVEAEEVAQRKKRIVELSSQTILLMKVRILLEKLKEEEKITEDMFWKLLLQAKSGEIGISDVQKIADDLKEKISLSKNVSPDLQ